MLDLDSARHVVTAVIVSHDGARWLPETMAALRAQSRPVQRAVAADTGSTDGGVDVLREYLPPDAVIGLPSRTGYGDAVRAALELPRSTSPVHGFDEDATEWIWLVHDDLAPEEDALAHLLAAADRDPRAAVLGPKLRDWFDRRLLIEAGVTIDGAGRRETGLEPREFDHGQHDGTRQVLAVSSAGMLVRRDVWERLGGFDRALPLFRDDIDLCWRVGGAGLHVLIVTEAVAYHAEASARRRRPIGATRNHPRRVDRRHAVFVLLANLPFGGMLAALLRNSVGSLLRVIMYLFMKQPANALDEAAAITLVYLRPDKLLRARFRRRRDRRRTYSAIRPYLARGVAARQFADFLTGVLSGEPVIDTAGRHQAVTTAPAPEDEEAPTDTGGFLRRVVLRPGPLLVIALTVVALVAERSLLFGPLLAGGALPPVAGGAADLWNLYLSGAPDSGLGSDGPVPPYVGLLALLSTAALGKPWIAVSVLLLGSVPLAGATAYLLAREVLGYRPARVWMAASYALLPVATGAIAQGRLGTAVVHVLMPVLGLLLIRVVAMPAKHARRAAWGLGLALAAATAFVPLVWPLALVTGLLVAAAFGHLGRRLYADVGIALGVPLVMLMPWTLDLLLHPSQWLLEAGLHRPELSEPGATPEQLLMLSPGGPGAPPVWVTAGLLAAALCALLLLRNRVLVAAGWSLAVFGLLVAILTSRLVVEPHFGGPPAAVWPGVALTFAATAVLLSAATAARAFRTMLSLGGLRRAFAVGVALLAVATPLAGAGVWMWEGVDGPLTSRAAPVLPGTLVGAGVGLSDDGTEPRTLVVAPDGEGGVGYTVVRGREPRLGEERIRPDDASRAAVDRAVAELAIGQGGDRLRVLADHGIQYVLYPRPRTGTLTDVTIVDMLDGTPGLMRESLSDRYGLWRLAEPTGRLRVVSQDGLETEPLRVSGPGHDFTARVEEGGTGRRLALAETAGNGWRASIGGTELTPAEGQGGTQAWELPAQGGELRVWHTDHVHTAWVATQGVLLLVVAVLAAPGVRTEEDARLIESTPAPRPRRPAGLRVPRRGRRGSRARTAPGADPGTDAGEPSPDGEAEEPPTGEFPAGEFATGEPATGEFAVTDTGSIRAVRGRRRGTRRKGRRRAGSARDGAVPDTGAAGDEREE
ncbi:glycosyltransferase [Nocardiopsis changdeensis]|uniref:Glycosyltransferase family 2 protein n=1 Tax=Nocardiopsis changdeensis TaxID=2831969 RepID=A0ABX8BNT6_9ACTN|nr:MULTISPECIES: glycosyltransferase family 2 protein [Nocardiopsis]QUX23821.1 glycosyltransferase family 2 protein [Nocardiopsis changdeensis]QYX39766.1 glycosyltransferase family 2 protein [Nocardiopsis sp. MT53]